jgi:c-di-GMP-binding flagellar brake protein YcgR
MQRSNIMETRLSPRINLAFKVVSAIDKSSGQNIKLVNGDSFQASTFDISETGMGIIVKKYYLPKGLLISLSIDGVSFGLKTPIKTRGEIRYCRSIKHRTYKCGVKFLNMPKKHKETIAHFIATYNRRKKTRLKNL